MAAQTKLSERLMTVLQTLFNVRSDGCGNYGNGANKNCRENSQ